MAEQKKFNLLRYVYGELYLNSLNRTVASITVETWKLYKWINILNWLQRHKHISALNIQCVGSSHRRISYVFNETNLIYPTYLQYLSRLSR